MKIWLSIATIAVLLIAPLASADENGLSLAKQNACMTCHAVDTSIVGPAFKAVAARYRGDANAEAMLLQKIKFGGAGAWGKTAMPPYPQAKDEDLRIIIKWVLSQ